MTELQKTSNAVYQLNYHLVIVVKYRKKIFTDDNIINALKNFNEKISPEYGVNIINQECGEDHIHLLIQTKPSTDICKYINILKGHSSRMLRKEFAEQLSSQLWGDALWSPSYFLSTVGNTSVDTIYNYIQKQREL